MANDFVDAFDLTHTMLWDESFQSWAELGVSLQPSAKLYSADGTLLREWLGGFDEDEVLELLAGIEVAAPTQAADGQSFCRFTNRFARAQRDAAAYAQSEGSGRQRILDDLRYGANAMSQTVGPDIAEPVDRLAAAVRAHSQVFLDAGLDGDPATATGRDTTANELTAAIAGVAGAALEVCDVTLEPNATP